MHSVHLMTRLLFEKSSEVSRFTFQCLQNQSILEIIAEELKKIKKHFPFCSCIVSSIFPLSLMHSCHQGVGKQTARSEKSSVKEELSYNLNNRRGDVKPSEKLIIFKTTTQSLVEFKT